MKKLYVVGNKVSKSLSPTIFSYWFKKYKIKASYGYLELTENNFHKKIKESLWKAFIKPGKKINVGTIVFQQKKVTFLERTHLMRFIKGTV